MKLKYILISVFFLCSASTFHSCVNKEPIERYCSGPIVYKGSAPVGIWIELKYKGELTDRVYLHKIDFDKYNVGDTIKCTESDSLKYVR